MHQSELQPACGCPGPFSSDSVLTRTFSRSWVTQPSSLVVALLSPFLIKFFSCNKHDHHLSFQTSQVSVQDLAFGVCWLNILPGKRTAPLAPANHSAWNSLLHLGASSALRTELSSSLGNRLCHRCSVQCQLRTPKTLSYDPPRWSLAPRTLRVSGCWVAGLTDKASATGDCWCHRVLLVVLQAQSPVTAFCVTGFQLKPAERSSWHFAAHESKVPPQPGGETPSA